MSFIMIRKIMICMLNIALTYGLSAHQTVNRRSALERAHRIVAAAPFFILGGACSSPTVAADYNSNSNSNSNILERDKSLEFVKGRILLPPGLNDATASVPSNAALYITCRPDRPDHVPMALLSNTRGKPPPVLVARFAIQNHPIPTTFPFEFVLSEKDLTVEGGAIDTNDGLHPIIMDPSQFWWKEDALIVSARLDMDGVAATRSPDDLVGRTVYVPSSSNHVELMLTGRGAFGKFATAGGDGNRR